MKHTKRALVLSAVVLILSVAMLAGATFAWFTDSVSNSGNKIEAGNLEVDLLQKTSTLSAAQQAEITEASDKPLTTEDGFTVISALASPVFDYSLWEPGYSTGAVFKVKNSGTLAFKFGFAFASLDVTKNLGNVLIVSVNGEDKGTLTEFATGTPFFSGILGSDMTSTELDIVIRMDTAADNDYQGATAKFDLVLKAVQTSLEEDGFGNADYDAGASEGWVDAPKADSVVVPVTPGEDTTIVNPDYLAKAEIPAAALAEDAKSAVFSVSDTKKPANITVDSDSASLSFDIDVTGLKADNNIPVAVSLFVGKDLTDVSVYHNSAAIGSTYDSATGIVRFTTPSFSPFTVVFDKQLSVSTADELHFALLKNGAQITLNSDIITSKQLVVEEGWEITLDLNGYALEGSNADALLVNRGTMTVQDGTNAGRMYSTNVDAQGRHTLVNYGEMTVDGGIYGDSDTDRTNANSINRGNAVRNYGTMTIKNGFFTNCDNYTNGGFAYALANGSSFYPNATMIVENATVYGSINGLLAADGGKLTVNNGEYTLGDGSETNLYRVAYTSGNGIIEINDGTFTRNVNNNNAFFGALNSDPSLEGIVVNGGTFTDAVHEHIRVDGEATTVINDGNFSGAFTGGNVKDNRRIVTTLDELKAAIADTVSYGGSIVLDREIAISPQGPDANTLFPQLVVNKDTTIDLKGTLRVQSSPSDNWTYTPAMFAVTSGTLTINGNGTLSAEAGNNNSYGINVNGGTVVINGGNYFGALTALQVQEGTAIINGGFFDLAPSPKAVVPQYAKYVVNVIDSAYKNGSASLMIYGGTFVNFDPSANPEGAGTSYVAEGYTVISEEQDNGDIWYTVVKLSETQN